MSMIVRLRYRADNAELTSLLTRDIRHNLEIHQLMEDMPPPCNKAIQPYRLRWVGIVRAKKIQLHCC